MPHFEPDVAGIGDGQKGPDSEKNTTRGQHHAVIPSGHICHHTQTSEDQAIKKAKKANDPRRASRSVATRFLLPTRACLLSLLLACPSFAADGVEGTLKYAYDDEYSAKKYGPQLVLEFSDGVVTVDDDAAGMEKLVVVLFAQEVSKDAFVAALEEKNGVPLFAAMEVDLKRYAMIDVCRNEDGSKTEVCGVHFYGPAISSSTSGFGGAFGSIVQDLQWADGRVVARLKSSPRDDQKFESIDLSFDLPLP